MKRRILIPSGCLILLLLVGRVMSQWSVARWELDGTRGLVFGALLGEDTVYAKGYSDSAFRTVDVGMAEGDVHALLGTPLDRWLLCPSRADSDVGERWSYSPGDTDYRRRVVVFRAGEVLQRRSEFYVD